LTSITPDERAALAGDLRYLASRIDLWAARWHTPDLFEFVSGIATETRRIAALPAASAPARERLTGLAAYLDAAVSTSSEFEAGAALRAAAEQLRELSRAEDRAAFVAGLRALARFLAAHPDVPVPESYHTQDFTVFPDGDTDDEKRAAVDATAAVLGVVPDDHGGRGHYKAVRRFGPVAYETFFVSAAYRARSDALDSYRDAITVDEAERPALVSVACGHCGGTGYCTRTGCETCQDWREATEEPECGACCGSAVCLVEKSAA
jgi:hypothetical protein